MSNRFHSLTVSKVTPETADTVSISFDIPDELKDSFSYTQGQYLTLKFNIKGTEVRRSYSMSSSPIEDDITVSVKRVANGLVSNYINDNVQVGTQIEVMPPDGRFFTKLEETNRKSYYLFGAGSGITPLMSILKTIVEQEPQSTVFLLYGNRNENSIIFKEQLQSLLSRYEGQLIVEHILSQPIKEKVGGIGGFFKKAKISWQGKSGRIDAKSVNTFLAENPPRNKDVECFICGPNDMTSIVEQALINNKIDKSNIHKELFTSGNTSASVPVKNEVAGAKLTVHLDGKKHETTVPKGKTVLDTLLDNKIEPPYSCTSGSCSTCMAKVLNGKAEMEVCYALDDDEIEEGFILTCQAHPTSGEIEITFDI